MNRPLIRCGVIGAGWAGSTLVEALRYAPDARLVAVAGGQRASELAATYGVEALEVDALLERKDVDAVLIASPHAAHAAQTLQAAASGKHVLVEKPMATSLEDCQAMIEACRTARVVLMVGHFQRFRRCPVAVKLLLDAAAIGRVAVVSSSLLESGDRPWQVQSDSKGFLLGYGVHALDLLRWWLGSEIQRMAALCQRLHGWPVEDNSLVLMEFASGVHATLQVTAVSGTSTGVQAGMVPFEASFTGTKGMIQANMYGDVRIETGGDWQIVATLPTWTHPKAFQRIEAYATEVREFIAAVREDREPTITGTDGMAAVALALAAYQAAEAHQWVVPSAISNHVADADGKK